MKDKTQELIERLIAGRLAMSEHKWKNKAKYRKEWGKGVQINHGLTKPQELIYSPLFKLQNHYEVNIL